MMLYIETEEETLFSDTLYYWLENEYAIFQSNGSIKNNKNIYKSSKWLGKSKKRRSISK